MGFWYDIRERYLTALASNNVDNWVAKEIQHNRDAITKFRSFEDQIKWIEYLNQQVDEETNPGSRGVMFYSFTGG